MLPLLAQAAAGGDANVSIWASLIGTIINTGFAAVVGWYLLTKAIPKMQDNFNGALGAQQVAFTQALRDQRADMREEERLRREDGQRLMNLILAHYEADSKRRDDMLKVEVSEVSGVVKDQREVMESVRDAVDALRAELVRLQARGPA